MTPAQRLAPVAGFVWPAIGASMLLVIAGGGAVVPLAPIVGVGLLAFLVAAPTSWTAGGLLGLALLVDNPGERPMDGLWKSPLYMPGELLYLNLHRHTGIGALRFSALELAIIVLMVIVAVRKLNADTIDDPHRLGALPNPMKLAFASMLGAMLAMMAWGIVRGGDFTNALWQGRQLFWLPVLGVLFGHSVKSAAARLWLLRIILITACVRAAVGIYFYFVIARPAGVTFEYVTTHSDSILAVVAVLIGVMAFIAKPSRDNLILNLIAQPILFVGLIVNDRRLAFVALFGGLLVAVLLAPAALRRVLRRAVILSIPLLIVYTAVGWNSNAGVFRPVGIVRSVTTQDDASSATRDIENYNLISTLKQQPLAGSGFGHEYIEFVQAYRVDHIFAQYLYIAHNSVLWLISQVGWLGFAFIWVAFPTAVLIAVRVLRNARSHTDVLTGFATVVAILTYLLQAWGDMGFQSWMGTLIVAALMGAIGSLWTSMEHERRPA
jgi:hypothetical protein